MTSIDLGNNGRLRHSSRRPLSVLAIFGLVAGLLAVSAGGVAAVPPTVSASSSVVGTTATISITVNRQSKAIAWCAVISGATTTGCDSPTSSTKTTTSYDVLLTDQTTGGHSVTVTIRLTDGGWASAMTEFTIVDIDADGDGVPDAIDNCPTIANAEQTNTYGSANGDACEDIDGNGILDVNEADMCVSVNGVDILASGTAFCISEASAGAPNIAVANGSNANAAALAGAGNRATAIGDSAGAAAAFGDNNTATATGDNAGAAALRGDNNTAIATGFNASASAMNGDNNTATATGDNAFAVASAPAGCTYSAPPSGSCN